MSGLAVKVYNNNVELALKKLKKKVKDSNLFLELKKKTYFEKPSKIKRERFLAREFVKHLRSKQMNEQKLRKFIRKVIKEELLTKK